MTHFIQSLEPRTFLSGTKADFLADLGNLNALTAAAKADLRAIRAVHIADTRAISAQLKGTGKVNAALLASLVRTESHIESSLARAANALFPPYLSLAKTSVNTGIALLKKITPRLAASASREENDLGTVAVMPAVNIHSILEAGTLDASLQSLAATNPTDGGLARLISQLQLDLIAPQNKLDAHAAQFQTDTLTLVADLASVQMPGPNLPYLQGSFSGTATTLTGKNPGAVSEIRFGITSENSVGVLAGSFDTGNGKSVPLGGQTQPDGTFVLRAGSLVLTGTTSHGGSPLAGTYKSSHTTGTFSLERVALA